MAEEILYNNLNDERIYIYQYDLNGICSVKHSDRVYNYEKDSNGNIVSIFGGNIKMVSYSYDAWGNCEEQIHYNDVFVEHNPFKWKGHYFDKDTGLYYINGNYYDPETGRYVNCNDVVDLISNQDKFMDSGYSIENSNPVSYMGNIDNYETQLKLFPKFDKDEWYWITPILQTFGGASMAVTGIIACLTGGWGILIGGLMIVAGTATIAIGMADLYEGFTNYNFLRHGFGWSISKYNKIKLGVTVASIILSIATAAYLARPHCFKEGTEVLTKDGYKPIEQIEVDDLVWAYDDNTGDKAIKRVVNIFRNETKQWTLVEIDGENGKETITCTSGHKFYLPKNKNKRDLGQKQEHESYYGLSDAWVSAKDLRKGDIVLLASGEYGKINSVVTQDLEAPETTYNFEVEDYHTYYVGENGTLVHNNGCDVLTKPTVENQTLQNHIDELYKGIDSPTRIGNGTTMDAIRYERLTGNAVGGKFHTIKGVERLNGINKLLGSGKLSYYDSLVGQSIADDLFSALYGAL